MPSLYPKMIIFEQALNRLEHMSVFFSWLFNALFLRSSGSTCWEDPEGMCKWSATLYFVFASQLSSLFLHVMSPGPAVTSSGLFKPCFILTIVADARVPIWVVFLLHFLFKLFFFTPFHLMFAASFGSILIPSVIWSSFSLELLKIPMFFSFYNCLFEMWHSMLVSNPLLSNHASCITVRNCVVLLILLCWNAKTVKLSISSNLRHLKRNSLVTVIETALFVYMHPWTLFALFFTDQ